MKYWEESSDTVILKFYGYITQWWNGANDFTSTMEELEKKYKTCKIRVHCYGGDVFEGIAISNAITRSKMAVDFFIDGIAASMMSLVMLRGRKIYMAENAYVMVHGPKGYTEGGSKKHFEVAKLMRQMEKNFAKDYARKTGKSETATSEWMDGEDHWFGADECKSNGLVDEITSPAAPVKDIAKPENKDNEKSVFNRFAAALTIPIQSSNSNIQPSLTMKKELIDKLGLKGVTAESSDSAVIDAVATQITGLQSQVTTLQSGQALTLIAAAETKAGKEFSAEQKTKFQEIGKNSGIDALQMVLSFAVPAGEGITHENPKSNQQPSQVPITSLLGGKQSGEDRSKWTFSQWAELDQKGLDEKRQKQPDEYKRLFKAEYGYEPNFE